jgi:hypothetical protein
MVNDNHGDIVELDLEKLTNEDLIYILRNSLPKITVQNTVFILGECIARLLTKQITN